MLKVLIVDDNRDGATALAMLVKMLGCETIVAYDGVSAIHKTAELLPNLILLDIGMPVMSGLEVCRAIRQTTVGRSMMIVAQTGWGLQTDKQMTKEAGFDAHLVKPIDPQLLRSVLSEATSRSEMRL